MCSPLEGFRNGSPVIGPGRIPRLGLHSAEGEARVRKGEARRGAAVLEDDPLAVEEWRTTANDVPSCLGSAGR